MKSIFNLIQHPLFSGSVVMIGGNMAANAVNYLYHLVMGRILGPVEYGVLASLYSIIYLIGIIPSSTSVAIVKFVSSADDKDVYPIYLSIRGFIFRLTLIISFILLVLAPFIANFLRIKSIGSVVLLSPILFLSLVTLVNQASSQGLLKFFGSIIPTLISSLIKLILGVAFVFWGLSTFGAMAAIVIGLFFAYMYSHLFIKRILKKTKVIAYSLKPFLNYSLPVLFQALAFTSLFSSDVLLVKHFFDPFQAGIYAALSTLGKIIFFATSPVIATMFPIISKKKSQNKNYQNVFLIALLITLSISLLITAFYWIFPDVAIGVLYGSAYLSAKSELVWMGIFILFYSLANLLVNYSLSLGNSKVISFPLVAAFVQIVMIWFLHGSLLMVIQISLVVTAAMFFGIIGFLGYNRMFNENNAK